MFDSEGSRTYDPLVWGSGIRKYFITLYSSSMESAADKRDRLHALENQCLEQHASGTHEWVHLPWHHLLETRHRMAAGKAPGPDGLVYEVFMFLPWQVLDMIRVAFENRLNCCPGHHEVIQAWQEILVVHIPKVAAAHKVDQWRPLCMLLVRCKWYSSCVVLLLQNHLPKPTCILYGFIPGRQTMGISELVRLPLQRFNEWDTPIVIIKSDVGRALIPMEHIVLDHALQQKSVPVCIQAALFRELVDVSLNVCHQDANVPGIELGQGGEQGGTETPTALNTLLDHVLGESSALLYRNGSLTVRVSSLTMATKPSVMPSGLMTSSCLLTPSRRLVTWPRTPPQPWHMGTLLGSLAASAA